MMTVVPSFIDHFKLFSRIKLNAVLLHTEAEMSRGEKIQVTFMN